MEWWLGIVVMVALALLRVALPLALLALLAYGIRRLYARWYPQASASSGE
jgi:hypothetical protein